MENIDFLKYRIKAIVYSLKAEFGFSQDTLNDVVQEMRIQLWKMPEGQRPSFYTKKAEWMARNFLKKWYEGYRTRRNSSISKRTEGCFNYLQDLVDCDGYEDEWDYQKKFMVSYNMKSAYRKGEKHPKAKLKEGDILDIYNLYINGGSMREIAKKYNVVNSRISEILNRKTWTNVEIPIETALKYISVKEKKKGANQYTYKKSA